MLRVWNVSLIVATFSLALLGTFLVRSGILESIHAFGASTRRHAAPGPDRRRGRRLGGADRLAPGRPALGAADRVARCRARRSSWSTTCCWSALCVVIFWGTFFPLISEAITGEKSSLGPPWFDRYTAPLAILLVLFTGIGPLLAWRRVSAGGSAVGAGAAGGRRGRDRRRRRVHRRPRSPAGAGAVRVRVLRARGARSGVLARRRGAAGAQRRAASSARSVASSPRNRRRYGGYIVHAGLRACC